MKKKPKKPTRSQFVKWINDTVIKYRHQMSLNHWQITTETLPTRERDNNFIFRINFTPDEGYLKASIEWSDEAFDCFREKDMQSLERGLIHELCHAILHQLRNINNRRYTTWKEWESAEETACNHISIIIHRILKGWRAK